MVKTQKPNFQNIKRGMSGNPGFLSYVFISIVLILTTACSSNDKNEPEQEYDIYQVNVKSSLNVRQSPSTRSKILIKLQNNSLVEVKSIDKDWATIKMPEPFEEGYVSSKYLSVYKLKPEPVNEEMETTVEPENLAKADVSPNVSQGNELKSENTSSSTDPIDEEVTADPEDREPSIFFNIVRLQSVPSDQIFSIAGEINDSILKNDPKWHKGWWRSMIDNFRNVDEHYTFVYIENYKLLTVGGSGNTMKYLNNIKTKEIFEAQKIAIENPEEGIQAMLRIFREAKEDYNKCSQFTKSTLATASPFEFIADDFVLQNILPNDTFFHKYLFSWVFYIPLSIALFFVNLTESWIFGVLLICLLNISCQWGNTHMAMKYNIHKDKISFGFVAIIFRIIRAVFTLSIISTVIYVIPDYTNIVAMQTHGFSPISVDNVLNQYATLTIESNWILKIGLIVCGLAFIYTKDTDLIALSTLNDRLQQTFVRNPNFQQIIKQQYELSSSDIKDLYIKKSPLSDLLSDRMSQGADEKGKQMAGLIGMAFIFNAVFILFVIIFQLMVLASRGIKIASCMLQYKKNGYYNPSFTIPQRR